MQQVVGRLLFFMRRKKGWTRGQLARRLELSVTVIYNLETGKSRVPLSLFFGLCALFGLSPSELLLKYISSLETFPQHDCAAIVRQFRRRLSLSQLGLAKALGYSSSSMIHHFEKGIREPSLVDLLKLMELAGDNVRGLVLELSSDTELAQSFPEGNAVTRVEAWNEYWSSFYISAIRQLMRTDAYKSSDSYTAGTFSKALGITIEQERHALSVLERLGIAKPRKGKLEIDTKIKLVIPKENSGSAFKELKLQWLEFGKNHFETSDVERTMLSFDILPANQEIFALVKTKIRELQNELHSMKLRDTDGFVQIGWMTNLVKIK